LVQILYILASILWLTLALYLNLFKTDWVGFIFIAIPLVVFFISYYSVSGLTSEMEEVMFNYDYLGLSMLLAAPLLVWVSKDYDGDRWWFIRVVMIALMLVLLSMVEVWVSKKWITFVKHLKSILQTAALVLLIIAFYEYFVHKSTDSFD
jgi:hypothetical protein